MILVSGCLLGICCRYDGRSKPEKRVWSLAAGEPVAPICPEQLGGLATPRPPASITGGGTGFDVIAGRARVINSLGHDVTEAFLKGAQEAWRLARILHVSRVILKSKSPSCGVTGNTGVTAAGFLLEGIDLEEL